MKYTTLADSFDKFELLTGVKNVFRFVKQEFAFEDAVDPLCYGVLVTVIAICHGTGHVVFGVDALVQR